MQKLVTKGILTVRRLLLGIAIMDSAQLGADQLSAIIEANGRVQGLPELHGEENVCSPWPLWSICILLALSRGRWEADLRDDRR